tara:strand:- start:883 stop:1041 length:159 start_codon:yes stop_codon:yes gene_type:complete
MQLGVGAQRPDSLDALMHDPRCLRQGYSPVRAYSCIKPSHFEPPGETNILSG